jgi:hypothetical protein
MSGGVDFRCIRTNVAQKQSLKFRRAPMNRRIKALLITSMLVAPLTVFAKPPGGNPGNGHGGDQGNHGNSGAADNPGGSGNHGNQGNHGGGDQNNGSGNPGNGHGASGGPGNDHDPGNGNGSAANGHDPGDAGDPGDGVVTERGHSQGPAHANFHAIAAVCKHQASATHSALGVYCGGGVFAAIDPKTGATIYSQSGTPAPNSQTRAAPVTQPNASRRLERPQEAADASNSIEP